MSNNNRTKLLFLIMAVILVLFLTSCQTAEEKEASDLLSRCKAINDESERDSCYLAASSKVLDLSVCEKIIQERHRGTCYGGIIFKNQLDYSKCDDSSSQDFIDNCNKVLAISTGNIEYCAKIQSESLNDYCKTARAY
ncbi:hypothetical protein GOV04_05100 [Candidatus Woesearchaeota archaeon]|nr:hypothetical protein [Candidatus Woesearchaeota archaeon]